MIIVVIIYIYICRSVVCDQAMGMTFILLEVLLTQGCQKAVTRFLSSSDLAATCGSCWVMRDSLASAKHFSSEVWFRIDDFAVIRWGDCLKYDNFEIAQRGLVCKRKRLFDVYFAARFGFGSTILQLFGGGIV